MGDLAGDTGSGPYKESPGRLVPGAGLGGSSTSPAGMAIGAPLRHSSLPEGKVGRAVESAGSDTGRTSADLGASYRKVSDDTGELAAICRGVDDVTERLIEYRNVYEPDDLVSPGDAADLQELLAKQVAAL